MKHKKPLLTFARILEAQITLDRAIKHIANRSGVLVSGEVVVLRQPKWARFAGELDAIMLLEDRWDRLECARIRKVKKAGRA